jgi:sphinganine-1-phosphate aldolase
MSFPTTAMQRDEVLATLRAYRRLDQPWREGRLFAGVYDPGIEIEATIKAAYSEFLSENALYPNYFPSLLAMENDIVAALRDLLRGDAEVVGNCTSGGTESIMLAVKAARDQARAEKPAITAPELIVSRSTHPAFHKAAHYLGLRVVMVEVDPITFRADPAAYRAAITPNTILLVASAPCYSFGVVDPIPEIAALAQQHGLLMHVDACVGGVQLSVMRRDGLEDGGLDVPAFDLSIPGVTSLSVDMHKFGYAAKNVSVILYRNRALRRYALFANAATTGYAIINTTVLSTKSGGPLAGAWAALHALGEGGYRAIVAETTAATQRLVAGINALPGLRVLGKPAMCMFTFTWDAGNIFELDDELAKRGWALQAQFSAAGIPANLHVSVNRSNVVQVDALLSDIRSALESLDQAADTSRETDTLRSEVLRLMASPGPETFGQIAALAGMIPGEMPTSFARINTVLDALPDELVDVLLVEYLNSIYG